jgi:RNA polymerase sigma-70 factor (family 1)
MSAFNQLTEHELLNLLKSGNHTAFTEIYDRHWDYLYKSAYIILQDSGSCDDLVQEIFVWLWINREKHFTDSLRPYLHTAVKYKVANVIRHQKVKAVYQSHILVNFKEATPDEDYVEVRELKVMIDQFTRTLPERARQIFYFSRHEMLSNGEIAEKLGVTQKTVENQMNINLKKLRLSLGKMSFWTVFL